MKSSLEYLEQKDFGDPDNAPTPLVKRCLKLCKLPLKAFTASDLRLMIGQGFSPVYLIPLAIEHLLQDVFIETDYFPGDLLHAVLSVDPTFWKKQPQLWVNVHALIAGRQPELALHNIHCRLFEKALKDV